MTWIMHSVDTDTMPRDSNYEKNDLEDKENSIEQEKFLTK